MRGNGIEKNEIFVCKHLQTDDVDLLVLDDLRSARQVQLVVLPHGVEDVVAHNPQVLDPASMAAGA
jgi:hypothetical protein